MGLFLEVLKSFPILKSLLLVAVSVVAARGVNFIFEHLVKQLAGRTKTKLDDKLVALLKQPIFWSALLGGVYIALLPLSLSPNVLFFFRKALLTFGFAVWGLAGVQISRVLFEKLEQTVESGGREMLSDLLPFLDNLVRLTAAIIVLLAVLSLWGVNITPALASAGVIGVAVAFAAKDTVANLFGGISVFFDRPYKVGDYVIVNREYRGEVIQIGMRSTKIKTRDNVLLTVPNSVMVTDAVINETGFDPKLRIRIPLGVSYGTDLEHAEKVLLKILRSHPPVLEDPKPRVRSRSFGDSAIELEALGMVAAPAERGRVIHELIKKIDKEFSRKGIKIPPPQHDVHLFREKER